LGKGEFSRKIWRFLKIFAKTVMQNATLRHLYIESRNTYYKKPTILAILEKEQKMALSTASPDFPHRAEFEKVWATLQEVSESHKKTARRQEELDRRFISTEKLIRRNGKQMGELHQRFGRLAEHLVAPGIVRRFNELGFKFERIADGNLKLLDEQGRIKAEIDLLLENGDYIIAVEVKARPVLRDIDHHKKRLEILREDRDKHHDQRKILGGIAGAIFEKDEKEATLESGMYVLEQSGDTMKINIPEDFVPREF
jgi:hypothetical protein